MNKKQKKMLVRIIIAAVLMIALNFVPAKGVLRFGLYLIPYLIIGYDILRKAWKGIINRQVFDENFLMAVATLGAIAVAIYDNGDYTEAIAVMLFYQVGEWFQSFAVSKSRRSIFPELCSRKEQEKYQCTHGYPSGLCECRKGWRTRKGRSGRSGGWYGYHCSARRKSTDRWCDHRRKLYIKYERTDRREYAARGFGGK